MLTEKTKKKILIRGDNEKNTLLKECHDSPVSGHAGRDNTIFKVKERYYWPGFYAETTEMVRQAVSC